MLLSDDDIIYDVFERYRVEEKPLSAGTGILKLPKSSESAWVADFIRRFNVMADDQVDIYVALNFNNFRQNYDNNGIVEIDESEGEVFMRALLVPNNRFRLASDPISYLVKIKLNIIFLTLFSKIKISLFKKRVLTYPCNKLLMSFSYGILIYGLIA